LSVKIIYDKILSPLSIFKRNINGEFAGQTCGDQSRLEQVLQSSKGSLQGGSKLGGTPEGGA
jgi:hypothetical protein